MVKVELGIGMDPVLEDGFAKGLKRARSLSLFRNVAVGACQEVVITAVFSFAFSISAAPISVDRSRGPARKT